MKPLVALALCLALAGCSELGVFGGTDKLEGDFAGPLIWTSAGRINCVSTYLVSGTLEIEVDGPSNDLAGTGTIRLTQTPGPPAPAGCASAPPRAWTGSGPVSGTKTALRFEHQWLESAQPSETAVARFLGVLDIGKVGGRIFVDLSGEGTVDGVKTTTGGAANFEVELR